MRKSLALKHLAVVFAGMLIPVWISILYVIDRNNRELVNIFLRQGRALREQIVVTRSWLSRHGGVYVVKRPSVKPSPFVTLPDTTTSSGVPLTFRSPETVTREMSEMAQDLGLFRFRMVSQNPINPDNLPDGWESDALSRFAGGAVEAHLLEGRGENAVFRYMAPVLLEASCTRCHQERSYRVGEVRGGISISFPVGEVMERVKADNRYIVLWILALGLLFALGLWLAGRYVILRPLLGIRDAVRAVSRGDYELGLATGQADELGDLARAVDSMRVTIREYQTGLEEEVKARTAELEKTRERAQRERDFLINLFEQMTDGICLTRGEDRLIEYINPSLEAVFGSSQGKTCHQFMLASDEPCENCPFVEGRQGAIQKREIRAPAGNRVFEVVETELENPDATRSWLMVFRDITERKWLENELSEMNRDLEAKVRQQTQTLLEQERLATLGEISAGLAHEIRNPLSAILSGASLLESPKRTPEERQRIIKLIRREAKRLNSSLTDFLIFAKPQEPKKVRIDLAGLVQEVMQLAGDDADLRGEVRFRLELDEMPPITFDDDQLRQLVWNMVLNSLQAMGGKGTLTIRARAEGPADFRLEIEDTGPGIPPEMAGRVFEPFFSTKKEGTGLGLSIVHRVVTNHGGTIAVEEPEGGGARIVVTAPAGWNGEKGGPQS